MLGNRRRRITKIAIALAICAVVSVADGQVYKCTVGAGKTTYRDTPCAAGSKTLKLPSDAKPGITDPHMCAQLLDETQRLAAEAERGATRGRSESARDAKRRQALTKQYAARCAGIARSEPGSK